MNIFDILIVVVAVVIIVMSARKGFVATCLDSFSMVISAFVSYKLCPVVANGMYDMFIKDLVKTEFKQALDDMSGSLSVTEKVAGMINSLPEIAVKLAESMGIDVNNMSSILVSGSATNETLIETIAETLAYDIMITLTEIIVFIALFIIATLLVRFISTFFSHNLEKLPFVGKLDSLLGGALGIVKALVLIFAGSVILYIVAQTAEPGSLLESIKASQIYMFMEEYNPIIDVLRGV